MRALVTGTAGFIGSRLAKRLIVDGWDVVGIDSLTPYYDVAQKRANVAQLQRFRGSFEFERRDLLTDDVSGLLKDVDVVFHQAAQPGVRTSWADGFEAYVELNVTVTQRLLEAARNSDIQRFVFASSSSVYGNASRYPVVESDALRPFSPYGVTKVAAEHLCGAYVQNFGVPVVALRYFTVYGPAQRPDMAIHRMIEAALEQHAFPVFGGGQQIRDYTFVDDVVDANVRVALATGVESGSVFNIAGGSSTSLKRLMEAVGEAVGSTVPIDPRPAEPGDVTRTGGSSRLANETFGWSPRTTIADGVAAQVEWHRSLRTERA